MKKSKGKCLRIPSYSQDVDTLLFTASMRQCEGEHFISITVQAYLLDAESGELAQCDPFEKWSVGANHPQYQNALVHWMALLSDAIPFQAHERELLCSSTINESDGNQPCGLAAWLRCLCMGRIGIELTDDCLSQNHNQVR